MAKWFHTLGLSVVRSDAVPAPKGYTPTWVDRLTAPLRRKTFERHPDDPGCWKYPDLTPEIQAQAEPAPQTDWLNNATPETGWHRIVEWRPPPRR